MVRLWQTLVYAELTRLKHGKSREAPDHTTKICCPPRGGPNIYQELLRAGYEDQIIPGWMQRPGRVEQAGTSEDQSSAGRTKVDQAEPPGKATLTYGVPEAESSDAVAQPVALRSTMLPGVEHKRLGIVRGGG